MTQALTPAEFHDAEGVDDWRVLVFTGACARYRTGSFATGVTLVAAIADLADAADRRPEIDLRADSVTVRTGRPSLTAGDLELARQIARAARELDVRAAPSAVQDVNLTIDAFVGADVIPFWRAALGYDDVGPDDLIDPHGRGPSFWFQPMREPRTERNRIHVDISVPHDRAEARVAAALAAGGTLVTADGAPQWWTLADAEGNEVDIATWQGRG